MERNKEVDRYIAEVPVEFRSLLSDLRERILEYLLQGEEVYAYRIPVYRYLGKPLFSIAAFKDHYSIVTQDKDIRKKILELKGYPISGTTVHFTVEHPATDTILRKIIQQRVSDRESDR